MSKTLVPLLATAVAALLAPAASAQVPTPCEPQAAARICRSAADLNDLLRSGYRGRVVIPRDARWEMRDHKGDPLTYIPLSSGVEIVGERGALGSRPLLYTDYRVEDHPLFIAEKADDVRVEGLHLRGPYRPADRKKELPNVRAIQIAQDSVSGAGRRVVITDNEIEGFRDAVVIAGTIAKDYPGAYRRACKCPGRWWPADPRDPTLVRVERNYLHNNAMQGGGYGVVVGGGVYATVEGNVFAFNNHHVAADGQAYSGYSARFNYVLRGVLTYGKSDSYPHSFDVHGRMGEEFAGGPAGTYFDVSFNTVLGEQNYGFWGLRTRAAFGLRGLPQQGAHFTGNVLAHDDFDEAVKLRAGDDSRLDEDRPDTFNLRSAGNRYDVDYSTELATGDFDRDGRTDVFVANGTAWFYSSAGIRPWQYLRASNKRIGELGLADIDNDGLTDVLYRDPSGGLGYVKSGTAAPLTPLTSVPVPIKDLRFGDFDGDGLTDMFYTRQSQWQVWYGSTRAWTPTQTLRRADLKTAVRRVRRGSRHRRRRDPRERLVLLERARRRAGPGSTAGSRARSPTPWPPTSTATARPTSRSATGRRGATAGTATLRSSRCETATAGFPTPRSTVCRSAASTAADGTRSSASASPPRAPRPTSGTCLASGSSSGEAAATSPGAPRRPCADERQPFLYGST